MIKLIDWEWAGFGVRHSDLASLLKYVSPELEFKALAIYQQRCGQRNLVEENLIYQWCKLQRGIFDAAFFAKEKIESIRPPKMKLDGHIERALERSLRAFTVLEEETR